jgi:hypothetical protein
VHLGETVTITGRQWPVIEFCKRRVRLRLESDQNAVLIGFVRVRDNGRFRRHWTPMAGRIGTGRWRIVARLRCESGEDGSPQLHRPARSVADPPLIRASQAALLVNREEFAGRARTGKADGFPRP